VQEEKFTAAFSNDPIVCPFVEIIGAHSSIEATDEISMSASMFAWVIFGLGRTQLRGPLYPQEQTSPAGPVRSEKCHMRKWHRSRNGIVRPVNGSTKPCMRENPLRWRSHFEFRRSFLARGG